MRKIQIKTGNYYHVFNRGVDKRDIFLDDQDFMRFIIGIKEFNTPQPIGSIYQLNRARTEEFGEAKLPQRSLASPNSSPPLVEIICYCLNKNHYHLLLKQNEERGIEQFMHKIGTGYTKYFNYKLNRSGSLFQGPFKISHIQNNEQLLYISGYINGNAEIHKISEANHWEWSSHNEYLGSIKQEMCNKKVITNQFKTKEDYDKYINLVIKNSSRVKEDFKKYLHE